MNQTEPGGLAPVPAPDSASALRSALVLEFGPVGVRRIASAQEFETCAAPTPHYPLYYCSAVRLASGGRGVKLARSDVRCDASPRFLGLESGRDAPDFVESYAGCGLYRDAETARRQLADVPALPPTHGLFVAPLEDFSLQSPPEVVIVISDPYGVMRITQAAAYHGHNVAIDAIGMHGICAESTAGPIITGRINVSLLCSGTRHWAGWPEHALGVGIPHALLGIVVDGLARTVGTYESPRRKDVIRQRAGTTVGVLTDLESHPYFLARVPAEDGSGCG